MTLDEIWSTDREDIRLVAYLPGSLDYVSLAHEHADTAFDAAGLSSALRASDLWEVGTITPDETGHVAAIGPA